MTIYLVFLGLFNLILGFTLTDNVVHGRGNSVDFVAMIGFTYVGVYLLMHYIPLLFVGV